jgi:uroporphyrinogen-III synthase
MTIVVTRPAHQADRLCQLIKAQGGEVIRFPTLEILPPEDLTTPLAIIKRLDDYEMAIFISANAVSRGLALVQERCQLPAQLKLIAIGKATVRELERWGRVAHLFPEDASNSEALLAMPPMQAVAGRRIIIFRGQGGRDLLGNTLRQRGAQVAYAEVYRRAKPEVSPDDLLQRWKQQQIQVVIVTSNDTLLNLFDLVGEDGQKWLRDTPLIVLSPRTQRLAQQLGFCHPPLLAREASDEAIVETLLKRVSNPIGMTSEDR